MIDSTYIHSGRTALTLSLIMLCTCMYVYLQLLVNHLLITGMSSHNGGIYYMSYYKGNRVGHCGLTTKKLTFTNLAKNWALKLAKGANFTINVIT